MGRVVVGEIGLRRLEAPTVVLAACGLFTTRGSGVNSAECPGETLATDYYITISRHNSFIPNIIDNTEHLAMNEASSYASARRHHNDRARQQAWLCSFAFVEYLVELTRLSWHSKPSKMSPFVLVLYMHLMVRSVSQDRCA